jgi:hypothetical protein
MVGSGGRRNLFCKAGTCCIAMIPKTDTICAMILNEEQISLHLRYLPEVRNDNLICLLKGFPRFSTCYSICLSIVKITSTNLAVHFPKAAILYPVKDRPGDPVDGN